MTNELPSPVLLWLCDDGTTGSPLAERMAEHHRVVRLAAPTTAVPGLGEFVLIAHGSDAADALVLARSAGAACAALILIAPVFAPPPAAEAAPDLPVLLLLGTDDARVPPSSAAALCASLPRAHPILIYGAGHRLDHERIDAVAAVMRDFIARRDEFIVRDTSDVLFP